MNTKGEIVGIADAVTSELIEIPSPATLNSKHRTKDDAPEIYQNYKRRSPKW